MALASTRDVPMASVPCRSSSSTWIALSAPIDSALRSASLASSGPTVSTVTSTSSSEFSEICSACSTAYSSSSESRPSTSSRSTVRSSAKCRSPVASGTYFTVTTILKLTPALLLHRHFWLPACRQHRRLKRPIPVGATHAPNEILLVSTPSSCPLSKRFELSTSQRSVTGTGPPRSRRHPRSFPQSGEAPLVVQERAPGAGRVAQQDLGDHDAVVPRGHPRDHPAHHPGEHVVQQRHPFRPVPPGGRRAEPVGAAAREGGRQLPLVLAEEVDADVVAGRDGGPGGTAGGDPEGEHRRVGGDGGERGGGEADRSPVAPRGDHRDARRVLPEDGAQQAGRAGPGGAEVGGCRHEPSFCGWNSG